MGKETVPRLPSERRWPWLFRLFRWYSRRYAAKHLHAVRVSKAGPLPAGHDGPLVIVLNHPSWWDPLLAFILSGLMPHRSHWGPIDATALRRYRFLGRAGLFGIELGTTRGAFQFLRTARAILADSRATLWIMSQGRFACCGLAAVLPALGDSLNIDLFLLLLPVLYKVRVSAPWRWSRFPYSH